MPWARLKRPITKEGKMDEAKKKVILEDIMDQEVISRIKIVVNKVKESSLDVSRVAENLLSKTSPLEIDVALDKLMTASLKDQQVLGELSKVMEGMITKLEEKDPMLKMMAMLFEATRRKDSE
jgi:hypothetical protein